MNYYNDYTNDGESAGVAVVVLAAGVGGGTGEALLQYHYCLNDSDGRGVDCK